jgi:hypothetical protein
LLALEPSNTSALFDLGQAYGSVKQTRHALAPFGEAVHIDPGEREAAIALGRAGAEMSPQLRLGFDFFNQVGRDGLARITRTHYLSIARLPYGDEDEYVDLGFVRASLAPPNGRTVEGNNLVGGFQAKSCDERLFVFGQGNLEAYRDQFSDRVTFGSGIRYVFSDYVKAQVDAFLYNVAENGESMRQDIYRYGGRAGVDLQPLQHWSIGAVYTYAHYSDRNDFNEGYTKSTVILCFPPHELKLVLTGDIFGYAQSTIFSHPGNTDDLVGTIHPYFSPHFYAYYEGRLTWKHWLSRDYFYYANQCWYSFEYGIGWDNSFNNYQVLRGLFNVDVCSWLSVGADSQVVLSPVYNNVGVYAYLIARLP